MNHCASCGKDILGGFSGYQQHINAHHTKYSRKLFEGTKVLPHRITNRSKKQIVDHAEATWLKDSIIN